MQERILKFSAEFVEAFTNDNDYPGFALMIAFGVGDPETDGHSWNFSRLLNDHAGVCTVREIQQCTLYEEIKAFIITRTELKCEFTPDGAKNTGYDTLIINYSIDNNKWNLLNLVAKMIFKDKPYFHVN